jgi:hypothetical protein
MMPDLPEPPEDVTLTSELPEPEMWERKGQPPYSQSYYYVHKETGREIMEDQYKNKVRQRNILAIFIEEIESVKEV